MTNISRRTAITAAMAAIPAVTIPAIAADPVADADFVAAWRLWSESYVRLEEHFIAQKWARFHDDKARMEQTRDGIDAITGDPTFIAAEGLLLTGTVSTPAGFLCKLDAALCYSMTVEIDERADLPWCTLIGLQESLSKLVPYIAPVWKKRYEMQLECEQAIAEAEKARKLAALEAAVRCKHCGRA